MDTHATKRVNIVLPQETLKKIDSIAQKGDRSRFINEAVSFYMEEVGSKKLKDLLKKGALEHAERDKNLAAEWFGAEYDLTDTVW